MVLALSVLGLQRRFDEAEDGDRDDNGDVTHGGANPTDYAFSFGLDYAGKIRVIEGFAEANVPVFRDFALGDLLERLCLLHDQARLAELAQTRRHPIAQPQAIEEQQRAASPIL